MTMNRRRFLSISAAFACIPAGAQAMTWNGRAFGADVSITLKGPREITQPALHEAKRMLTRIEGLFSLYDPTSTLSELNRTGRLHQPDGDFIALMEACDLAFNATGGLFDPTVQALWAAMATETEQGSREDWSAVRFSAEVIELAPRQTLTFNGIAQGFATDRVTEVLERHGLANALVNIGEYRALGGPWRLGVSDPHHGLLGMRSLSGRRAIATSSARATLVGGRSHILHHTRAPIWSTVSVEADTATLADSLSTALVLAPKAQIKAIKSERPDVHSIVLVDTTGDLVTL